MSRNIIAKLFVGAMAFAVSLPIFAVTETVDGITWRYQVSNGKAEIYNNDLAAIPTSTTGAITIPATLGGYPITSIGSYAFRNCSGLTSVTIPGSVTSIGSYAFYGCSGLRDVVVPQYVCNNRMSSVFPSAYQSITNVIILDGVTSIGSYAFSGCSGLTSVTIPDSVTSIGNDAFSGCNAYLLDTTTIPGVELLDGWVVGNTGSLSGTLNLTGVRCIGDGAFSGCSGLTGVTIPDSVTSIGSEAFSGCSGLTSVTIPDSVTSIGEYVFFGCSGLTSVTIPASVVNLPTSTFDNCGKLWNSWYRTLVNVSSLGGGGSPSVVTTVVQEVGSPYALTNHAADHAIASVTVDGDCAIDEFVLKDGKVYDCVLYVNNVAESDVMLTLPAGNVYKAFKGARPLVIPAKSQHIITITRVADTTFLVSREELETIQ